MLTDILHWLARTLGTTLVPVLYKFEPDQDELERYKLFAQVDDAEDQEYEDCVIRIHYAIPVSDTMLRSAITTLSPDLLVKGDLSDHGMYREVSNVDYVRRHTTIPIPTFRRIFISTNEYGEEMTYVIMDRIRGRNLAACWDDLGFIAKLRVVWIIRGYIAQMQRLRRPVPGPIESELGCLGRTFGDEPAGPFASYAKLNTWFNHKLQVSIHAKKADPHTPPFDQRWPLVLCHTDLHMNNILISNDGTVFLIDWENAGFYPKYLEGRTMKYGPVTPWLWQRLIPFMAGGSYWRENQQLAGAHWAIYRAPFL